jgi:hypothetical protein
MSKLEVNAVEPQCGTNLTLGASGDTIVIPSGATISNQGTAAGFGPTGAVSWNTTKITANPNPAVTGVGYFADTTSAAFTITLPSSPAAGAVVGIADYANTFATNNLTIGRNGSNIGGIATNSILSTNGLSVTFVYVDATQGWIVTDSGNRSDLPTAQFVTATGGTILTCGDFKTHVFTGPGTFTVSCAGNAGGSNSVEYLVVAGGGGGGATLNAPGSCASGGGGGAGGYRQNYPSPTTAGLPVSATSYPITVGGGGPGIAPGNNNGTTGSNSIFSTITSSGGGGAGSANISGLNGGSGGGAGYGPINLGGTGNTPPTSPPQGNTGGAGGGSPNYGSGGGGGANATGSNGQPTAGGAGGAGSPIATTVFGPTSPSYGTPGPAPGRYFAGGGGGGLYLAPAGTAGAGGAGGGGAGGTAGGDNPGNNATTNTGGGGGGATKQGINTSGGNGGSGIIVIRYKFQ